MIWPAIVLLTAQCVARIYTLLFIEQDNPGRVADVIILVLHALAIKVLFDLRPCVEIIGIMERA